MGRKLTDVDDRSDYARRSVFQLGNDFCVKKKPRKRILEKKPLLTAFEHLFESNRIGSENQYLLRKILDQHSYFSS